MESDRQEEVRLRMSERLTRELEVAARKVREALERVRGDEADEERLVERQFTGQTDADRIAMEADKIEVALLEEKARKEPPPKKKRSLAVRMYGWNKRRGR